MKMTLRKRNFRLKLIGSGKESSEWRTVVEKLLVAIGEVGWTLTTANILNGLLNLVGLCRSVGRS